MDKETVRQLALALPDAEEKAHFGRPDFRVRNRIFATLPKDAHAVVKLTPDQQEMLISSEPSLFKPVIGGWGRQGWTEVMLAHADEVTLKSALLMAWRNVAPASLQKGLGLDAITLSTTAWLATVRKP
ncbi:MmcQ/YjbR family DNA-binding protein [Mesorhizobium sp. BAC0120]|uniref:MmcQ/YjbR family DNA-binding protein n=1 Tax=Mesorhizobium sp. BAC0120 TaxID=3090670 RepID=UPI00298C6CA1|nr:MmcQ/YjbR family DNA-binding protein [Mesorhizobium sp. BAC0120]MDW6026358.1 MmcQ/YjbR family DNA-binding protein [Mesorhizobium sp. BAC0120]